MRASLHDKLRRIPSVDQVLSSPGILRLLQEKGRPAVLRAIREHLESLRKAIQDGESRQVPEMDSIAEWVERRIGERAFAPRRVLNATGVVLHTNLGRARLAPEAVDALLEVARGACDLEFDLRTGKRSSRGRAVHAKLCEMTGAPGALVVNNNAGALVLCLNELSRGKEAIVSRGELVEIGGSFRLPDVMERTGAKLREVGTTNRTHLEDYERAIGPETALIVKVHRSNFRLSGFVKEPSLEELVDLGRRTGCAVLHDLGSGSFHELPATAEEPSLSASLAAGVDLLTFSGDKLLGGPQAGIILGRQDLVERLRRSPLARALRVDKFTIAALAATLDLLEDPLRARTGVPVLRALSAAPEELAARAQAMARSLGGAAGLRVRTMESSSEVGGGALPGRELPTTVVAISHERVPAEELARELRGAATPVIARIEGGEVLLDPRSLDPSEDDECARVITERARVLGGGGR
jgi:L-seryl-tRNA(Ser) seleniumtransferase